MLLCGLALGAALDVNAWEVGDAAAWQSGTFEWDDAKAWNKVWDLDTNNWRDLDEVDRTVPSSDATLKFQDVTLNINDGQQITQKGVSGAYFATLNQGVGTFIYVDANGKDAVTNVKLENVTFDGVTDAQFNGSYVTGGSEFLVYGSGENQKTYVEVVNSDLRLANITFGNYSNSSANAGSIEGLIKGTSE